MFLLSLTVRVIGLDFGLPYQYASVDESIVTDRSIAFTRTGDWNPHYFQYPTFGMVQVAAVFEGLAGWQVATGASPSLADARDAYYLDPTRHFLVARAWTVLLALIAIGCTFKLAREFASKSPSALAAGWVGVAAAALLAVSPVHAHIAKFVELDVPLSALAAGCVWLCVRHRREGHWGTLLTASVLAGLGGSTKYYGALLCLPVALAVASRARHLARPRQAWGRLAVAAVVTLTAFLAGSPYIALDFDTFWRQFEFLLKHQGGEHFGQEEGGFSFGVYLRWLWGPWGGAGLCIAAVCGVLTWWRRLDGWNVAIAASFPAAFFLLIGRMSVHMPGYLAVIAPFIAVAGAVGIAAVAEGAGRLLGGRRVTGALSALAVVALVAHDGVKAIQRARDFVAPDTRSLFLEYAEQHLPNGSAITCETWLQLPLTEECLEKMATEFPPEALERDGTRDDHAAWQASRRSIPPQDLRPKGPLTRHHVNARLHQARTAPPDKAFDFLQLLPRHMDPELLPLMRDTGIRFVVLTESRFRPLLDNPDLDQLTTNRRAYAKMTGFYRRLLDGDLVIARFPEGDDAASGPGLVLCDLDRLPR